jgi:ABC-type oligopeptide transport system ATPase subunit
LGRAILRLVKPTAGEVRYRGQRLGDDMRPFRQHMQIKRYSQATLQMKREALGRLDRRANEHATNFGTAKAS